MIPLQPRGTGERRRGQRPPPMSPHTYFWGGGKAVCGTPGRARPGPGAAQAATGTGEEPRGRPRVFVREKVPPPPEETRAGRGHLLRVNPAPAGPPPSPPNPPGAGGVCSAFVLGGGKPVPARNRRGGVCVKIAVWGEFGVYC